MNRPDPSHYLAKSRAARERFCSFAALITDLFLVNQINTIRLLLLVANPQVFWRLIYFSLTAVGSRSCFLVLVLKLFNDSSCNIMCSYMYSWNSVLLITK